MKPLPLDELDMIVEAAEHDLRAFAGCHLVITGGTGFVGSWLVESALRARDRLAIPLRLSVLTRSPDAHLARRPHLAEVAGLTFIQGDIRSTLHHVNSVDAVIHAATEASAALNESQPTEMLDVIVSGMTNVLELIERSGPIPLLFTSSGAVYGRQPLDMGHMPETYTGAPDVMDRHSAYHEGKRLAELLGTMRTAFGPSRFISARLFAFVGPMLPLDSHFAVGNFIGNVLSAQRISITGDGTPLRSYMHPVDLTTWLWGLLARGQHGRAYNVGSEHSVSIRQLADLVNLLGDGVGVEIGREPTSGRAPERYVPSTERARSELGLTFRIELVDAIERTLRWHRNHRS